MDQNEPKDKIKDNDNNKNIIEQNVKNNID